MCSNYRWSSPKTSTILRIHLEATSTSGLPITAFHPEDISDSEPHFFISRPLPLWSPHLLKVSSTTRTFLFRRLQLRTWSSNNESFLISTDSYVTSSFPTFITCKCLYQHGQLWTMTDFLTCNPNQPVPMITTVTTNPSRADHAVTIAYQFCLYASIHVKYILFFFFAFLILRA